MLNVFLVDDDVSFVELIKYYKFKNLNLICFSSAIEAVKSYDKHRPQIVVSDVQMPGIHGVDFAVICKQLMKPRHFIYISANSKEDVEKKYGTIGDDKFFKKHLDESFYDYLEALAKDLASVPVSTPQLESSNTESRVEHLRALFELWEDLQKLESSHLEKTDFSGFRGDEYYEERERIEREISGACKVLNVSDEELKVLYSQFETRIETCDAKIRKYLQNIQMPRVSTSKYPVKVDFRMRGGRILEFQKVELIYKNEVVEILRDDRPINAEEFERLPTVRSPVIRSEAHNLRVLDYFVLLENGLIQETGHPLYKLLLPFLSDFENHSTEIQLNSVSLNFPEPYSTSKFTLNSLEYVRELGCWGLQDKQSNKRIWEFLKDPNGNPPLPRRFQIKAVEEISAQLVDDLEYQFKFKDKVLHVPVDELVACELRRGFLAHDTKHRRAGLSVEFAWQVAFGKKSWFVNQKEIKLEDLVERKKFWGGHIK